MSDAESHARIETAALIRHYYEAFNAGNSEGMLACLTDDVIHDVNQGERRMGIDRFKAFNARMDHHYKEKLENVTVMVSKDGSRAAAEFNVHGVYKATDSGLPEAKGQTYILPAGTFSVTSRLSGLFALALLLSTVVTGDIFAPLFLQRVHGFSPLWAGYVTALVAAGWSLSAISSSGWTGSRVRAAIALAPIIMLLAMAGLAFTLGTTSNHVLILVLAGVALTALGAGIGSANQHLSTRILSSGTAAENSGAPVAASARHHGHSCRPARYQCASPTRHATRAPSRVSSASIHSAADGRPPRATDIAKARSNSSATGGDTMASGGASGGGSMAAKS